MIYISIILLIIAGIANAMMDVLKSQWHTSKFQDLPSNHWFYQWAGPNAWLNKWIIGSNNRERFFLSSTALVFLTDGWHFFQMIWGTAFTLAIVFYQPIGLLFTWLPTWLPIWIVDFVILKSIYLIAFNIFYERVFK
jgi:hypothetical protein